MSKSTSGRSTPASAALLKLLELPDLRERFALCLMNVYGDEKDPAYWLRRAEEFEAAAPRPSDFHGKATEEELDEAWLRCLNMAELCRLHGALLAESLPDYMLDEIDEVLEEILT